VTEDCAHAETGESRESRPRPLLRVGTADRPRQDRHALPGQPDTLDGRDEVRGRLADQADRTELRLVEDARGDALGARVDLRPGVPRPLIGFLVEDHQIVG